MRKEQQVNAVALAMQGLLSAVDAAVTQIIGSNQHNIVLVIGCADVSQYAANVPRPAGIELLKGLLARWHLGMDDVLPGEVEQSDTRAFEYLLNAFEQASQAPEPAKLDYGYRRKELLNYVGRLEAKAKRVPS
ncbi:hypothetical protein J7E62_27425 [Variovorax paradoxus]|nr:hypothetical protein [Variovorax paradoxus]